MVDIIGQISHFDCQGFDYKCYEITLGYSVEVSVSSDTSSSASSSVCLSDVDITPETPPSPDPSSPSSSALLSSENVANHHNERSSSPPSVFSKPSDVHSDNTSVISLCDRSTRLSTESTPSEGSLYCCKWTNCDWPGNYDDLVDHIREIHVELQPYQRHNWSAQSGVNDGQSKKSKTNAKREKSAVEDEDDADAANRKRNQKTHHDQQQYVCLWEGCKVYGKGSLSRNWLERHVLQHSGPRPFKCIVEGCGARFKMQSALERHVNSHFKPHLELSSNGLNHDAVTLSPVSGSESSSSAAFGTVLESFNGCTDNNDGASLPSNVCTTSGTVPIAPLASILANGLGRATMMRVKSIDSTNGLIKDIINYNNGTPNKILKRKKSATKLRRKCVFVKGCEDFFDECVMEKVRFGLAQLNAQTGLDITGTIGNYITFRSGVIGRRENNNGDVNLLLHWEPHDILPDVWVPESELSHNHTKVVPISSLPSDALMDLLNRHFSGSSLSQPKSKQRRK